MPLGHALMIFMEHVLSSTALHYAAFTMGAVGLVMVIIGVFAKRRYALTDIMGDYSEDYSSGPDGQSLSTYIMHIVMKCNHC